ncbi:MAG: hypothetical protein ACJ72Z_01100 [Pyrinomonadaceae bacterium]
MKLETAIRNELGENWIPHIYDAQIRAMRTRSFEFTVPERENQPEILHTLLGIELKIGRSRFACPDLATARYLSVFARIGCRKVAVPYDISVLPGVADELETSWHRMLLILQKDTKASTIHSQARIRSALLRLMRSEIAKSGAGDAMPLFDTSTRQREN